MSLLDPPRSETPTSTAVVAAAVLVFDGSGLPDALDALAGQVYEPSTIFVVGGGEEARRLAERRGVRWVRATRALAGKLGSGVTHVWILHDDVRPRPDALAALVREAERIEASVAGSKVLRADQPGVLESVGGATDVFGVPYTGLDQDEVDQQQYDVIRDVAFVSSASILIRRDLLRGLGGPDLRLPPEAGSIDFCQRARLAGGRVVVVPSSEVVHVGACSRGTPPWREEAGRLRAILKAYGPLTLAWVLPLALLTELLESVLLVFLGRRRAPLDLLRAWAWNLVRLRETARLRRQARRGRPAGDEELFRYQVRGSERLRRTGGRLVSRLRDRIGQGAPGPLAGLVQMSQEAVHHPIFLAAAGSALFVLVATRQVWAGSLPLVGYALPPTESAWRTLQAYAGGWNVAGLGSPEPMRPAVGAVALLQLLLLGREGLTAAVLTVGPPAAGILGAARLLRRFGVGPYARYGAGVVLVAGPVARALTGEGYWPMLPVLGALPWAVAWSLDPWPKSWPGRVGRAALLGLITAGAGVFLPGAVLVPPVALGLWALVGRERRWGVAGGTVGALLALPLLFPWLYAVSGTSVLSSGVPAYWVPSAWTVLFVAAAGLVVLAVGDEALADLGGWALLMIALGALVGRSGAMGVGFEAGAAGLSLAALGTAVLTGAVLGLLSRLPAQMTLRRGLSLGGVVAGLALVAGAALVLAGGRAGLPPDRFGEPLRFTASRQLERGASRALLLGPGEMLPGEVRRVGAATYRVISVPEPRFWEVWLPEPRLGDQELENLLARLVAGQTNRVGEELAPFGIRWVVLTGETPFEGALGAQLDLRPLPGFDYSAFQNEAPAARAVADDGTLWDWEPPGYRGPAGRGERLYLAENGHDGWGPEPWSQAGWANQVSTASGRAFFAGTPLFRVMAQGAGLYLLVLGTAAWWGRKR